MLHWIEVILYIWFLKRKMCYVWKCWLHFYFHHTAIWLNEIVICFVNRILTLCCAYELALNMNYEKQNVDFFLSTRILCKFFATNLTNDDPLGNCLFVLLLLLLYFFFLILTTQWINIWNVYFCIVSIPQICNVQGF